MAGNLDADFDAAEDLDKAFDAAPDVGHQAPAKRGIPTSTPSDWAAVASGAGKGLTFGFGDELGAAEQAALMKLTGNGDYGETYRRARDENRTEDKAATKEHPWLHGLSAIAGTVPSAVLGAPFKAAQGAGLLSRAIIGAGNGLVGGAAFGAGESEGQDLGAVAHDAAVAGAEGAGAGGALPLAGAAARGLYRSPVGAPVRGVLSATLNGLDKRSAAAGVLQKLGVDTSKMSTGQLAPGGYAQTLEEAAEGTSPAIRKLREGGREAWQDAVLQRAAAPGAPPVQGADVASKLESAHQSFGPAYDPIASAPVTTAGAGQQSLGDQLRADFTGAAANKGVLATDAERASIAQWLDNQASIPQYQPGSPGTVDALLKVRSNIRSQARALPGSDARKALLGNAEDVVTQHLENNLTPQQAQALQNIDNQYRRHLLISGAASRANGAPAGFTPAQLEAEVKAALGKHAFARGGGDDLRQLADAGRDTLDPKVPLTGMRQTMSSLPKWALSPAASAVNSPTGRALVLGESPAQAKIRALIQALRSSPTTQTLGGAALREPSLLLGKDSQ